MFENIDKISKNLKSKFYYNYNVSNYTWFRAGGKADVFCIVIDENELEIILNNLDYETPIFVIGVGSNLLIRDGGFRGLIIKLGKSFNLLTHEENQINAGASILDSNLSKFAYINSIKGFEFFSGIPGSVGGAVKMNAGCFGSETKDLVDQISLIKKNGNKKILFNKDLFFSYRNSILTNDDIVTNVKFKAVKGNKTDIKSKIDQIKTKREITQPLGKKTGGSTFKNPKGEIAAKLIEEADCKGLVFGDAAVSNKHSNFLINLGKASAKDIETLGKIVKEKVENKLNISLEWEIKIIGEDSEN